MSDSMLVDEDTEFHLEFIVWLNGMADNTQIMTQNLNYGNYYDTIMHREPTKDGLKKKRGFD